jgi:hypothetical protein
VSDEASAVSIRSILISVRDLDRSSSFYQDVINVREVLREDQIAVLGSDINGPFMLYLREAGRHATMMGQGALGVRAFTLSVGSLPELDRVEARLRAQKAFSDRRSIDGTGRLELVQGHDPDRLPLRFLATEAGTIVSLDQYHRALGMLFTVDL